MGSVEDVQPVTPSHELLRLTEAAKFLNKSKHTIKRYVYMGVLRSQRIKGRGRALFFKKHDLEAYKRLEEDIRLGPHDLWLVVKGIRVRIHAIDQKLDFLMHVNGLNVSMLRDESDKTLMQIYDEACDFLDLDADKIPPKQMEKWAYVIMQITELELDRMIGPCQDFEPWKPFHELCQRMLLSLRRRHKFRSSNDLQQIYRLLDKARKSIAQASVIFTEEHVIDIKPERRWALNAIEARMDSLDRYIAQDLQKHPSIR